LKTEIIVVFHLLEVTKQKQKTEKIPYKMQLVFLEVANVYNSASSIARFVVCKMKLYNCYISYL